MKIIGAGKLMTNSKISELRNEESKGSELIALYARRLISRLTNRWVLPLLSALHYRRLRFCELRIELTSVSDRMLIKTLQDLSEEGFVKKEGKCQRYYLTERGEKILSHLQLFNTSVRGFIKEGMGK